MTKIIVAIDSFKGSASSSELNQAVKEGILADTPDCEVETIEISDGGEGTLSVLHHSLGGELVEVETVDLLKKPIQAKYLLIENRAFIEVAEVVGIDKITPNEKTILLSSTFGLAQLCLDAKKRGVKEIIMSLGGTGTSDGGLGLLQGLGVKVNNLLDFNGIDLSSAIDFSELKIIGLADVKNTYAGDEGFAKFFGKQKGGSDTILNAQNAQAKKLTQVVNEKYNIDLQSIPGTGAAGGLGGALVLLGGKIEPGFEKIAQLLNIEDKFQGADLVITGEGRMDFQTANGKVPYGMAKLAEKYKVPTIAFCGALGENLGEMEEVLLSAFSIQQGPVNLEKAMENKNTLKNIKRLSQNVLNIYLDN